MLLVGARTWIELRRQELHVPQRSASEPPSLSSGPARNRPRRSSCEVVGVLLAYQLIEWSGRAPLSRVPRCDQRSRSLPLRSRRRPDRVRFRPLAGRSIDRGRRGPVARNGRRLPVGTHCPGVGGGRLSALVQRVLGIRGRWTTRGQPRPALPRPPSGGRRWTLRSGGAGGRLIRSAAPRLPTPAWLAARRLAASRYRAIAVVAGAAMSVGLVLFAGSMSASLQATIDAKATLAPGSRQILRLEDPADLPADNPLVPVSTRVTRIAETSSLVRGHAPADVLRCRSSHIPCSCVLGHEFAGRSLASLLDLGPPADARAAGLAVGDGLPDTMTVRVTRRCNRRSLRVTGRRMRPGFGFQSPRPLVVVDRNALGRPR